MRYYIKKLSADTLVVYKETTTQSILSDLLTIIVLVVVIGLDIIFSLMVTHSFVIDILVASFILLYFFGVGNKIKKEYTKKEILKEIETL